MTARAAGPLGRGVAATDPGATHDDRTDTPSANRLLEGPNERVILVALAALVTLVCVWSIAPWPVGVFEDDGIYTVLARSLAEGNGFRLMNLPGEPHNTHYPPGYPLLLMVLWKLWPAFPDNVVLFKFANAALIGLVACGTWTLARRRGNFGVPAAFCLAVVGSLSVPVLYVAGVVMSEPLFMALLLPTLLLSDEVSTSGRPRDGFVLGILLGSLTMVRTMGALAVPAVLLVCCMRRRFRVATATALGAATLIVPWQIWVAAFQHDVPNVFMGKYGSYTAWVVDGYARGGLPFAGEVFLLNVASIGTYIGEMLMPAEASWLRLLAFTVLCIPLVAGAVALAKRAPAASLFLLAYITVVCFWPFSAWRFVVAIWPLIVLIVAMGVRSLWRGCPQSAGRRAARGVLFAALFALAVGYGAYTVTGYRDRSWEDFQRMKGERGKALAEWVSRNTGTADRVATDLDLIVYLYTGRQAVPANTFLPEEFLGPIPTAWHIDALRAIMDEYDPRFVIAGSMPSVQAARALVGASPPRLRLRSALPTELIFETLPRTASSAR